METVALTDSDLECPVCHEDFTEPKLLPCTHLVCKQCIASWLTTDREGGCPLCRAAILDTPQTDLTALDALPTDLSTIALVECQRVLRGPQVCAMCPENVTATSYCFVCQIMLCPTCTSYHQKLPVSKDHTLAQTKGLTAQRLTSSRQSACQNHADRSAEVYCTSHQEVICILCATTNHRHCEKVKAISDAATKKRSDLRQLAQELTENEEAMADQMNKVKQKFIAMRRQVKDVFDDLVDCVEKQREAVIALVKAEEEEIAASLIKFEKLRANVVSHVATIGRLEKSSPDGALLQLSNQLKTRLDDLKAQSKTIKLKDLASLSFNSQCLKSLKSNITKLGNMEMPAQNVRESQCFGEVYIGNMEIPAQNVGESQCFGGVYRPIETVAKALEEWVPVRRRN